MNSKKVFAAVLIGGATIAYSVWLIADAVITFVLVFGLALLAILLAATLTVDHRMEVSAARAQRPISK